jgi:DHA2 family multidrug resistance protein
VALGGVPPEEATAAASIFNLARRMGGNIGFALLTTILERRVAYHRINLLSNINEMNEVFYRFKSGLAQTLLQKQVPMNMLDEKSYAIIDRMVDHQATMLAYNDLYIFLGLLFVAITPLVLLLKASSDRDR